MNAHAKSNLYAVVQSALIGLFAVMYFLAPGSHLFHRQTIVGDVLSAIGLVVLCAAIASLREVIQVQPEPKAGGHLVTRGIYRRLRHPIYSGMIVLVAGLFLREPGLHVAVIGAVVVAFLVVKAKFEEKLLRERYPEYEEYVRRSWGVLPGL